MINPTLFIGLGSTGLDIIVRFQELVLEHYGRASMDIFKYIAIETREAAEVTRSEWGENEIKLLRPVIKNTDAIRTSIASGHKQYLRDWLNPKLLELSGGPFTDGAANIRMAGRLILWENWDNIKSTINDSYNQITGDKNIRETKNFLKSHYARYGQPIDGTQPLVGDLPNVYIVGTFCGGTCSGMFIDIGYYTKQITGLFAKNLPNPNIAKIMGIFTTFDAATLNSAQQEGIRLHAANSWAALMEYDFFCHPQTRCHITFPDGTLVNTNERPIDWLYLISCTATNSNNTLRSNFRKSDGKPDEESLRNMAATILFTETVGGLLGEKDGIRINYRSRPRATETNENEHSPCIATSGIATIWYPKYRIALGAACKYGASLCEEWVGTVDPNTKQIIEKDITNQWYDMLNQSIEELVSSPSGNIMEDIKQELDKNRDRSIELLASQFKDYLQEILSRLNKGKKCDTHVSDPGRVSSFKDKLTKGISDFIQDIIDTKSNLAHTEYSLEQLDKAIAKTIEKLPSEYPAPDLSIVEEVSSDIFGKLVFKTKEIESQRKKDILSDIKIYMENQIKNIRNFRMCAILEEIKEEIGISRSLPQVKVDAGVITVKQSLDTVKSSLGSCIEYLEGRYKALGRNLAYTEDVRVVSDGSREIIKDDIDQVVAQLKNISPKEKQVILNRIKSGQTLNDFLGFGSKEGKADSLKEKITEQLIREVLERVGSFNVINHVLGNWTASEINEFAKHGLPHLELTPGSSGLSSVKIGKPVSFVAGGYKKELNSLVLKLAGTSCQGLFEGSLFLPELSHMLIFYREEPLMYIDDNLATATLFEECYRDSERTTKYGLHIHKGGKNIFDPQIYARRDKTKNELMPIAINLFSIRDKNGNWTSSDTFRVDKNRLVLRDTRKSGAKFRLTGDENGIELCAQEKEIFEIFNSLMEEKLENMTKDNFIERLNSYLDWIEIKADEEGREPGQIIEEERRKIMEISLIKERFPEETED